MRERCSACGLVCCRERTHGHPTCVARHLVLHSVHRGQLKESSQQLGKGRVFLRLFVGHNFRLPALLQPGGVPQQQGLRLFGLVGWREVDKRLEVGENARGGGGGGGPPPPTLARRAAPTSLGAPATAIPRSTSLHRTTITTGTRESARRRLGTPQSALARRWSPARALPAAPAAGGEAAAHRRAAPEKSRTSTWPASG